MAKEEKVNPGNCNKCKQKIHPKDNFCRLSEWKQGVFLSEGWYHVHCFREGMHGDKTTKELEAQAKGILDKANRIMDRMGSE